MSLTDGIVQAVNEGGGGNRVRVRAIERSIERERERERVRERKARGELPRERVGEWEASKQAKREPCR